MRSARPACWAVLTQNPLGNTLNGDATLGGLRHEEAEAEAEGADAAPGLHDVAVVEAFERGDAGAVVADDAVDGAVGERDPERVAVGGAADGRAALELGAAGGDVRGGEREVVEARLHGEREAGRLGSANERERARGGEVHNVQA